MGERTRSNQQGQRPLLFTRRPRVLWFGSWVGVYVTAAHFAWALSMFVHPLAPDTAAGGPWAVGVGGGELWRWVMLVSSVLAAAALTADPADRRMLFLIFPQQVILAASAVGWFALAAGAIDGASSDGRVWRLFAPSVLPFVLRSCEILEQQGWQLWPGSDKMRPA